MGRQNELHVEETLSAEDTQPDPKKTDAQADFSPGRRKFVGRLISFLAKMLVRLEFHGTHNIPASGKVLITTNHLSRIDTAILLLNPVRDDLAALVADKYLSYPFIRFLVESMPHVWIDRSRADFAAFNAAVEYLKRGWALGIAPEGTRSKNGALIEGKPGAAMIAQRARVTVVPVGISGSENFNKDLLRLRRARIVASFGPPFTLPPIGAESRSDYMRRCTDEIMCRIALQLPEKYHGVYAGHPRLMELLGKKQ